MDNILIVGHGAVADAMAKKLKKSPNVGQIYVAAGNGVNSDYCQNIDIREDDITELLKFALENDIKLTVVTSQKALKSDIAGFFSENGQNIFAPSYGACRDFLSRAGEKKFLYRIHAQCPKFGVFSRIQDAKEYADNVEFPVIISTNESSEIGNDRFLCPTGTIAKKFFNDLNNRSENDIVIEEFIYGKNFTLYFITDGYTILPITSVCKSLIDEKGFLTRGVECFAPNFYITEAIYQRLCVTANNIINNLERRNAPYVGILGLEGIICSNGKLYINGIKTSFDDIDACSVLNTCEDDLYKIFTSCVNGFFSDEYEEIKTNALNFASALKTGETEDRENVDFITPDSYVKTCFASTLRRAKEKLNDTSLF